ncbi:anaerobic ribonucleoside-triphosphate reductase activating protein [Pollutimonas sp. H1-120]
MGGVTPFTATDYPGQLAAAVFVQGCPWRCGYCHNPHLQERTPHSPVPWEDVLALLERRVGLIDAVVFSGGEPTMDPSLPEAIREARALGFKIGLHTGGTHPQRLTEVLPMLDWVGLDIKAGFADYARITKVAGSGAPALASLQAVLASGIDYECRSTAHAALLPEHEIKKMARALADMKVRSYALQAFRSQGCEDQALNAATQPDYPGAALIEDVAALFPVFTLRRH